MHSLKKIYSLGTTSLSRTLHHSLPLLGNSFQNVFPYRYQDEYTRSIQSPEQYWSEISKNTVWTKPWTKVLDDSNSPFTKWFVGGRLNLCYNAVDRHVDEGYGDKTAIVWDSPITNDKRMLSFEELRKEVTALSGLLVQQGVGKGDRVVIYMPMIPETLMSMLACARIGAVHSVVFGGFAANELAKRIRHLEPKIVLAASCGVELSGIVEYKPNVDKALKLANAPESVPVVTFQRTNIHRAILDSKRDIHWQDAVQRTAGHDCVEVESNHPLYVLYTSGTTGQPKGIVHPTGSHAVVNKWTMKSIYGMNPDDVWWAASDFGWIVGQEYTCYSPLLNGNTTIIYEGKPVATPDSGQFFRVISDYKVNGFFTTPTTMRMIMSADPLCENGQKYDISKLKYAFIAGERCDSATMEWTRRQLKVPVLDHWWQTEVGHAITASCVGLGCSLDPPLHSAGMPVPGFNVRIVRENGSEAPRGETGRIVCKLPLAPGTMSSLYKAPERFKETYFSLYPGYYDTMDAGIMDEAGNVTVVARQDDVINVAGRRFSTYALEEVLLGHPEVIDAAVVGVPDNVKGQVPIGFYVSKTDDLDEEMVNAEIVARVKENIGPVAFFKQAFRVKGLPKTRSGKTARKSIAEFAAGQPLKIPPTIEDPTVYDSIRSALKKKGYELA